MTSTMTGQATAVDDVNHHSKVEKGCCVDYTISSSCGHAEQVSLFKIVTKYFFKSINISHFSNDNLVQYHSQIIPPDIRPPID